MNEHLSHDAGLSQATEVFKAVAHPARLRILAMLRRGALCVCQITAVLDLSVSTVSAHLAELKRAGLVVERKDGRWVSYSLAGGPAPRALLGRVRVLVAADPQVQADARLVRGLRRIPVENLCRAELDLARLGLRRHVRRSSGRNVGCRQPAA
jgi:DNA-binding transcriptional ArsR family regulator